MTVPAAGDFKTLGAFSVICPICDQGFGIPTYMTGNAVTIRDLIAAASDHARTHAVTEIGGTNVGYISGITADVRAGL